MFDKVFYAQLTFSLVTVGFCMGMIINHPDATTTSVFMPILTSIVGVWVPSPKQTSTTFIQSQTQVTPNETTPLQNEPIRSNENNV